MIPEPIIYENSALRVLDQRKLPFKEQYIKVDTIVKLEKIIKNMAVRGAPLIGITSAYGFAIGIKKITHLKNERWKHRIKNIHNLLINTRPTAVNIKWALSRMEKLYKQNITDPEIYEKEAIKIHEEEKKRCEKIANYGKNLIRENERILTYCNTGKLATGGIGTAMGIIYKAKNKIEKVFVCETRPYFQGARLTTWELSKNKIPHTLIIDSEAGFLMSRKEIGMVLVGADRIAKNGDTANKIGTYTLALLASYHNIPFYVAAPISTFDFETEKGEDIPLEIRNGKEIRGFGKVRWAPDSSDALYYAFDITPHKLIAGYITDKGILKPPFPNL